MLATAMREGWPHAPPHYFTPQGIYIITAATLHQKPLFNSDAKLDLLRDTTLDLAKNYALILQAWAFLSNHYHVVINFENSAIAHRDFIRPFTPRTSDPAEPVGSHSQAASNV